MRSHSYTVPLASLALLFLLTVSGSGQTSATAPSAATVRTNQSFMGRVISIDTNRNTLTILMANDDEKVVILKPDTRMKVNGTIIAAKDFKAGEVVVVRGSTNKEGNIVAAMANNRMSSATPRMAPRKQEPLPK